MKSIINPTKFSTALLCYYDTHRRTMPWRDNPTPYAVWISEVMLQQTQVTTVIPYFNRFMKALPTPQHLASASRDQLEKLWEGLGYYSRVHRLKDAAQIIVRDYDGELPSTFDELLALPGIGPYTAGAVASIAFNLNAPAVDGNALRVFSRLLEIKETIDKNSVKAAVGRVIIELQGHRPGDFNQAIFDLGATVCTKSPQCNLCPVVDFCHSFHDQRVFEFPKKKRRKAETIDERTVLLLKQGDSVIVHRRPNSGLLAGMWEFVNLEGKKDASQVMEYLDMRGFFFISVRPLTTYVHKFSHVHWHITPYLVELEPRISDPKEVYPGEAHFVQITELNNLAFPTAFKPLLEKL
ncbi:A/G-specific adenine glycosylase [Peptoniphilus equinus]|uniref:Adenine DNA glycosylase n=1 Tax=Peptoniphilus equinus TaxID=3016343 RepID=A0ABY7QV93_9FIRM|nr:A/G-specific adenine glycosylase [Peptoniphilus equinus]WBW50637.1 A/G-specific adenine glycosylase [Peptoniphilus equinus]